MVEGAPVGACSFCRAQWVEVISVGLSRLEHQLSQFLNGFEGNLQSMEESMEVCDSEIESFWMMQVRPCLHKKFLALNEVTQPCLLQAEQG